MTKEIDFDALVKKPFGSRVLTYLRLSGPGYMQSAMTLGGGSVASCAVFGSMFGYQYLWVQPLAMLLGYFVLAAVANQTTNTQERSYTVFWERISPVFALLWGGSALIATVLWHIPQYSLTANGVIALAEGVGVDLDNDMSRYVMGALILLAAGSVVYLYNAGARGLKLYEFAIKVLVWSIVFAFMIVVFATGVDWARFLTGITGIDFIRDVFDGDGLPPGSVQPIVAGLAAAVGINMIFLYPYSLLNKKWGPKQKELAYFDLISGMALPFILATSFMILAVANTIGPEPGEVGEGVRDIREIIPVLAPTFSEMLGESAGTGFARFLIGMAMTAIGFSTIITHMLACGFIGLEMTNWKPETRWRLIFAFLPAIGVVGVTMQFPIPLAITASTLALPLMPVTVACFFVLMNTKSYMGDAMPRGFYRLVWNTMLIASVVIMSWAAWYALQTNWGKLQGLLNESSAAATTTMPAAPAEEKVESDEILAELPFALFDHAAMGTQFELRLYGPEGMSGFELQDIAEETFAAIDEIEATISRWQPGSYTSAINAQAGGDPVVVPQAWLDMFSVAQRVAKETDGAFDPTVLPLIEAWNRFEAEQRMPSDEELADLVARVGMKHVDVDTGDSTVRLKKEGMAFDFGAIGKGFALDLAARNLRRHGIERALIHGGTSSIIALKAPPGDAGWTVNLAHPEDDSEFTATMTVANRYISTSSAVDKGVTINGVVLGHILDPATGRPIESLDSVTVMAESAALADGLSTAFYVMGLDAVQAYCTDHSDVAALVYHDGKAYPLNWPV